MDQPVGARVDRLPGGLGRAGVEHGHQVVAMRGADDPRQGGGGMRRHGPVGRSGFVDHLDEVRPFGGPVGNEGFGPFRVVQGRQRDAELRAVPLPRP